MFAHDVSLVPGTGVPAFGSCFPPPTMAECKARAVCLLPDVKAYWLLLLQLATVKSIEVAAVAAEG